MFFIKRKISILHSCFHIHTHTHLPLPHHSSFLLLPSSPFPAPLKQAISRIRTLPRRTNKIIRAIVESGARRPYFFEKRKKVSHWLPQTPTPFPILLYRLLKKTTKGRKKKKKRGKLTQTMPRPGTSWRRGRAAATTGARSRCVVVGVAGVALAVAEEGRCWRRVRV